MAEKTTKVPIAAATAAKEAVMYIGPTKFGAVHVANGTIFKGGVVPVHLVAARKANKDLDNLFVPISKLGAAKKELDEAGSPLALSYAAVVKSAEAIKPIDKAVQ